MSAQVIYAPPADIDARRSRSLVIGVGALVLCAVGFFINRDQFFRAWLIGYMLWLGVALGSMGLMMIHHLSGGAWGMVVRRVWEASSRTLPLLTLLFVPVALGMNRLYPWTHAELMQGDEILRHKAVYFNPTFFLARAAFYFIGWNLIAWRMTALSRAQDEGHLEATRSMQRLSGGGLVFLALSITFVGVDWFMSLNPDFYSTMFGFLFLNYLGLAGLAFTIIMAAYLRKAEAMGALFRPSHFADYGKLTLAFVMMWAYFQFSQYLLVYAANLHDEIPYVLTRIEGGWQYLALFLLVFQFVVPFCLLLSRPLKQTPDRLVRVALWLLIVRVIDTFMYVTPEFSSAGVNRWFMAGEHGSVFFVNWLDVVTPVAIGGLWFWMFYTQLRQRPLLPIGDPYLASALEASGGH
ncbi:MAG TPA: hypothetical protein VN654_20150 [Vicinamibacterales bacterium]|nr:hypothetical protein [Vicinamibacterales bacterium]